MTWMTGAHEHHDSGGDTMPGMATIDDLNALRTAKDAELDRKFLELMRRHHEGGLAMLVDAGSNATVSAVRGLANRIAFHQQEESRTIQTLLTATGR